MRNAESNGHVLAGQEVAKRFGLLLEKFPRGDGELWRPVEIEEATGHEVSGSYVVALKKGKFKRPGLKQLSLISDVVGFPFELWRTEPEFWDEELKKHKVRGSLRGPLSLPEGTAAPLRRLPAGEDLGKLVDYLFRNRKNPATGEPYTEEEVATNSRGRLSANEVRLMRQGQQKVPPPDLKLVAFSDVFDAPVSHWWSLEGAQLTTHHLSPTDQVVVEAYRSLTVQDREVILAMMQHLGGRVAAGTADNCGSERIFVGTKS